MPVIALALVGLLAFPTGAPAPEEASSTPVAAVSTEKLAVADAPVIARAKDDETLTVKLTSYNAVPGQTDDNPFVTASGAYANPEVVAARSVDLASSLPFGTVIALTREGADTANCGFSKVESLIGYRVIADSMHPRKREQVDILLDQNDTVPVSGKATNPSLALGMCDKVSVRVIGTISVKQMPATQDELRALVEGNTFAVAR